MKTLYIIPLVLIFSCKIQQKNTAVVPADTQTSATADTSSWSIVYDLYNQMYTEKDGEKVPTGQFMVNQCYVSATQDYAQSIYKLIGPNSLASDIDFAMFQIIVKSKSTKAGIFFDYANGTSYSVSEDRWFNIEYKLFDSVRGQKKILNYNCQAAIPAKNTKVRKPIKVLWYCPDLPSVIQPNMPTKGVKGALLGGEFEDGSHFEVSKIIRSDEYLGQKYKSPDNTTNLTVSTSALD